MQNNKQITSEETIFFTIYGKPQGKGRPRFTSRCGHPSAYTPKPTIDYEKSIQNGLKSKFAENEMLRQMPIFAADIPLAVYINAYFEPPKSKPKKWRNDALAGYYKPLVKPDIDNIAKVVLDALNGLAYADDKQVSDVIVSKRYVGADCQPGSGGKTPVERLEIKILTTALTTKEPRLGDRKKL